jgi:hypothetical protein
MTTSQEWYNRYPEKKAARTKQIKARQIEIREKVKSTKIGRSCIRCGFSDPRALHYHHRDPSQKTRNISEIYLNGWGWERIEKELAKCDLLCANCHHIEHSRN